MRAFSCVNAGARLRYGAARAAFLKLSEVSKFGAWKKGWVEVHAPGLTLSKIYCMGGAYNAVEVVRLGLTLYFDSTVPLCFYFPTRSLSPDAVLGRPPSLSHKEGSP